MVTLEKARELLDDETLTDAEVAEIRDTFRILAEIIFEQWLSENGK